MKWKLIGFAAASLGAITGLTAGVGMWTVQEWLQPMAPLLFLASAILGVFLLIGGAWFYVTKKELEGGLEEGGTSVEERGWQRLTALVAQLLFGLAGLSVAALWNFDAVRANFVSSIADSPVQLERALKDPSPKVKVKACLHIFDHDVFRSKNAVIAALDASPETAGQCLQKARENNFVGYPTISENVVEAWTIELLNAPDSRAGDVCELTKSMPEVERIGGGHGYVGLLKCALNAESNAVRKCCADALGEHGELLTLLGDPGSFPAESGERLFAAFVSHGFRPASLQPEQQEVVHMLGTDDEEARRWMLELGCTLIDPSTAQPEIVRGFLPFAESSTCGLGEDAQAAFSKGSSWANMCAEVLSGPIEGSVEDAVCKSLTRSRVRVAVAEASAQVHAAARARFLSAAADDLIGSDPFGAGSGGAGSFAHEGDGGGGSVSGFRAGDDREMSAREFVGGRKDNEATCNVVSINPDRTKNILLYEPETSFECKKYPDDMTISKWAEMQKKKRIEQSRNPMKKVKQGMRKKTGGGGAAMAQSKIDEHGQGVD